MIEKPQIAFDAQIAFDPDQLIRAHGWQSVAPVLETNSAVRRLDGFGDHAGITAEDADLIRILGQPARAAIVARDEVPGLILHRQPAHVADRYQPARAILRIGKILLRNRLVAHQRGSRIERL